MKGRFQTILFTMSLSLLAVVGLLIIAGRTGTGVRAASTLLYVAPGGNCGGATPCYSSVQDAVDAALQNDEIRIAAGLYTGINNKGGLAQVVYIDKNLTLRGGYTTSDWNNPDPDNNVTEINALGQGRVMVITGTVEVTLDGLRLTYGNGANQGDDGGGLFVHGAILTLRNTHILSSTVTDGLGGGVALVRSQAVLQNCIIEGNSAQDGGGVGVLDSIVQITGCQVNTNNAGLIGSGGVKVLDTLPMVPPSTQVEISDSTIDGNSGSGASFDYVDVITITNSTVSNNDGDGIYISHIPDRATIRASTIQGNQGNGIDTPGQNLVIEDNLIADNHGGIYGGVRIWGGSPVFRRNVVRGNSAYSVGWGGGISFQCNLPGSSVDTIFTDNIVKDNYIELGGQGGGLYLQSCDGVTFERNWIINNSLRDDLGTPGNGTYGGAGVYLNDSDAIFINNVIAGNRAEDPELTSGGGSGVYVIASAPTFYHNTIASNTGGGGEGIYVVHSTDVGGDPDTPSRVTLYNNIIANQTVGVRVDPGMSQNLATIDGILWWNNGTNVTGAHFVFNEVTGNPLFVDAPNGNYHIQSGSAAIDAANPAYSVAQDIDLEPRLGASDLGADEYWAPGALKRVYLPLVVR